MLLNDKFCIKIVRIISVIGVQKRRNILFLNRKIRNRHFSTLIALALKTYPIRKYRVRHWCVRTLKTYTRPLLNSKT